MASFFTLVAGSGYLKNFGPVLTAPDPDKPSAILAQDLLDAEDDAYHEILGSLAALYPKATVDAWASLPATSAPKIVLILGKLLGSSYAWLIKYSSDVTISGAGEAEGLRALAQSILGDLRSGKLAMIDISGTKVQQEITTALMELA